MRLIDADELMVEISLIDLEERKRNGFNACVECIEQAPTIKSPIETLQELRAEIDREGDYYDTNIDQDVAKGLYKAVQIIDRKISEVRNESID